MPEEMHRVQLDTARNLIPSASEPGRNATQIADNTIASKADPVHMLGFMSLRGSIATLTQHVGTLTQQLHVLSQEVETLSKRDDCLTRGDLVRELQGRILPNVETIPKAVDDRLRPLLSHIGEDLGEQVRAASRKFGQGIDLLQRGSESGSSNAEALKQIQPLITHLITILAPISQLPLALSGLNQAMSQMMKQQSHCTKLQEQYIEVALKATEIQSRTAAKQDESLRELASRLEESVNRNVSANNNRIEQELSSKAETILETKMAEMEQRMVDRLTDRYTCEAKTSRIAIQQTIMGTLPHLTESVVRAHISLGPPYNFATEADPHPADDTPPQPLSQVKKRRISVSSSVTSDGYERDADITNDIVEHDDDDFGISVASAVPHGSISVASVSV